MSPQIGRCRCNNLELNISTTVEMLIKKEKKFFLLCLHYNQRLYCDQDCSYTFLGFTICKDLKWERNIVHIIEKSQQRMFCQLGKHNLPKEMLCRATVESVLCSSVTVYHSFATQLDTHRLQRVFRSAELIIDNNTFCPEMGLENC